MSLDHLPPDVQLCVKTLEYAIFMDASLDNPKGDAKKKVESIFGAEIVKAAFEEMTTFRRPWPILPPYHPILERKDQV